ncbi:O-methyltransferase-domain-containing protein [Bombardia bombarda]|uniref:O-methyltransferase-domain-containing protein n=1 Tax=Bombardia bombarda TaxID=252184 RepID=A0AA39WGH7_9PEZI|nr:O-methyltransferase-domain-containing protein [Bombardia bombarda]
MAEHEQTLESLAAAVSQAAKAITSYLNAHSLTLPSFSEDGPADYPKAPELSEARFQLLESLMDMTHLALGPTDFSLTQPLFANHDGMTLDILTEFGFFSAVPLGGSATYGEIARATTLPESIVRRVLRYAATLRLFAEAPLGSDNIVHTATTAYLARNPKMQSWVSHMMQEGRPAVMHGTESLRKYSAGRELPSQEVIEAGFSLADLDKTGHPVSYWDYVKHTPEGKPAGFRAKRFAEAMQAATAASATNPTEVIKFGFDWESLGEATVVDMPISLTKVGGSSGHVSLLLANAFPKLNIVVQDMAETEGAFHALIPPELRSRVTFQPHDFFNPQPTPADVYLLKSILHDWSDKYATEILRNLLVTLKPGGRILLCEPVNPPTYDSEGKPSLPGLVRRTIAAADLQMLVGCSSLERSLEDWQRVAKLTDERLQARRLPAFPQSHLAMVELVCEA